MSQTIQSIHSLSMELNRAASQCSDLNQSSHHFATTSNNNNNQHHHHLIHNHHRLLQQQQQQQQQQQHAQDSSTSGAFNHSSYRANSNSIEDLQVASNLPTSLSSSSSSSTGGAAGGIGSSRLSRLVGKKAARVKEILLQNLGKADKTTDELFQLYEENFYKQQAQASKLQKEFKSYLGALKLSQEADRSLNNCIQQSTGDYQSARHDLVCENLTQMEHLNEDLMEKLRGQVMLSINEYLTDFNDLRGKISKRKRKLIDYDSSRRIYESTLANLNKKRVLKQQQAEATIGNGLTRSASSVPSVARSFKSAFNFSSASASSPSSATASTSAVAAAIASNSLCTTDGSNLNHTNRSAILQNATNQLVDEARLLKLREQYNYCKIMFETINSELYEELPMVYDKKMKHLLMTLQNYFSLEAQYHLNAGKLFATASDVIDELPMSIHNNNNHHHHHHLNRQQQEPTELIKGGNTNVNKSEHNNKPPTTSGSSSGMGSSRAGDSSLESSSSPDSSSCNELRINEDVVVNRTEIEHDHDHHAVDQEDNIEQKEEEDEEEEEEQICNGEEEEKATSGQSNINNANLGEEGEEKEFVAAPYSSSSTSSYQECAKIVADGEKFNCVDDDLESADKVRADENVLTDDKKEIEASSSYVGVDNEKNIDISKQIDSKKLVNDIDKEKKQSVNDKPLYKVKTSYKYLAEDVDELCFEADEIIQVIEFDETQEPEEGWLMGIREVNGQRGLFPANFTQPI